MVAGRASSQKLSDALVKFLRRHERALE